VPRDYHHRPVTVADKTAVVIGGTSGIGRAIALSFAEEGANVIAASRTRENVEAAVEEFGSLDVVVANAGLGIDEPIAEMSDESYHAMMDVNVDGSFYTARAALSHLVDSDGSLVFVSSFSGQYPRPANPVYAATKWWIRGFALSLQAAVGDQGIGITQINPTEVRTQFGSEDGDSMAERHDPGEVSEPGEVAEAIVFAVAYSPPTYINSIDIYRRDKFCHF
jgi:NADP-dependent 3-hydroxy acid dehydrogenase YdfG